MVLGSILLSFLFYDLLQFARRFEDLIAVHEVLPSLLVLLGVVRLLALCYGVPGLRLYPQE